MGRNKLAARAWYDKSCKKWHIRDGDVKFSLGFGYEVEDWEERCNKAMKKYLAEKDAGSRLLVKNQEASDVLITDVILKYIDVRIENWVPDRHFPTPLSRPEETESRLDALAEYFAGITVDQIDDDTVKGFANFLHKKAVDRARALSEKRWAVWNEQREKFEALSTQREQRRQRERRNKLPEFRRKLPPPPPVFNPASVEFKPKAALRYLEDLKSAVSVAVRSKMLKHPVPVPLPPKYQSRKAHFTRMEVQRLIDHAMNKKGLGWIDGKPVRNLYIWRHLARFMIMALYTGSRKSKIVRASFNDEKDRPWIELREVRNPSTGLNEWRGYFHRLGEDEQEYRKKGAPGIEIPLILVEHLVEWRNQGIIYPCLYPYHSKGCEQPGEIARAMRACLREVFGRDTKNVVHTFRHTAATWLVQIPDMPMAAIAGYLGMSIETLMKTYAHYRKKDHAMVGEAFTSGRAGMELTTDYSSTTIDFGGAISVVRQKPTEIDKMELNETEPKSTRNDNKATKTMEKVDRLAG